MSRNLNSLSEKLILDVVNQINKEMALALACGDRIEIRGFGSFDLHYHPPRNAHNPKTGEKVITKAKYSIHFKPGKEMRNRINANRHLPIKDNLEEDQ